MAAGPEPITVRPMKLHDLPDILEIERRSFPTPWSKGAFLSELLDNKRAHYLVADYQGKAVGYIGLWLIAGEGHITNVAVHPNWRHRGIGRRLMEAMADYCISRGARRMTLEVRRSNIIAQRLYESLGFVYCGTRKGYYRDNGEDAFIMWRELDQDINEAENHDGAGNSGQARNSEAARNANAGRNLDTARHHDAARNNGRPSGSTASYLMGNRERPHP